MNGPALTILADASWLQFSFSARTLGMVLWIGLGVLTVSLILLSRTRWGQAKPLSKCVVLSIFAHLLLIGYAYGTRLILDVPPPADRQVIKLTLVEPGDQSLQSPQEQTEAPPPWERFVPEESIRPDVTLPERLDAQPVLAPHREAVASLPAPRPGPLLDAIAAPEASRPAAEPFQSDALRITRPLGRPAEIEKPKARRRDVDEPIGPTIRGPGRVRIAPPSAEVANRHMATQSPEDFLQSRSAVQQLAELPLESATSELLAGPHDLSLRRANPSDAQQPPSAAGQSAMQKGEPTGGGPDGAHLANASGQPTHASGPDTSPSADPLLLADSRVPTDLLPRRLGDGQQLPSIYQYRISQDHTQIAVRNGGSARTEAAVKLALKWLASHQSPDGRWNASLYGAGREENVLGHDRRSAGARADTGLTGLALLAFLASGHSHLEGPYRQNVQRGIEFLLRSQAANGSLAGDAQMFAMMYCHGMALLALSEAYAITGDARLKPYVERAVQFTADSQHPTNGGWRYRPGDSGDMSQFGWQVMALKSAQLGGIAIPERTHQAMQRFLRSASSGQHGGLAAYRPGERTTRAMTAEALTCRFFLAQDDDPAVTGEATRFISEELPSDGKANLYYWYYATLALYQARDEHWPSWNDALKRQLISRQRTDGDYTGSWDPETVWGSYGGRVYSTALAALCLEVYYRYLPVFEQ